MTSTEARLQSLRQRAQHARVLLGTLRGYEIKLINKHARGLVASHANGTFKILSRAAQGLSLDRDSTSRVGAALTKADIAFIRKGRLTGVDLKDATKALKAISTIGPPKRRIISDLVIKKISAVTRPASEPCLATIIK